MTTLIMLALCVIPDARLTPGAADPAVTRVTVGKTICQPGYTAKVRSVSMATKKQVVAAYRAKYPDWPAGPYEIDHLISLEIGGSNDAANLWPQPIAEARKKDVDENRLHRAVCTGKLSLVQAQAKIIGWHP